EAIRQGASEVIFVEAGKTNTADISVALNRLRFTGKARVITRKVLSFLESAEINRMTFDIIFLDPPYHTEEILLALSAIGKSGILRDDGTVAAEHFTKRELPDEFGVLRKIKDYHYGDTTLSLYKKANAL
ncbi:MAG: hypothetical protein C4560_13955, partial [Nitrospiraceae bacterium]